MLKFIGIKRDIFATVSSMLQHHGVLSWYRKLPLDEPNRFLGITAENKAFFSDLPLESKCAIRCLAHFERLDYLHQMYPNNVLVVNYEDFYDNYQGLIKKLKSFLNLNFNLDSEPLNPTGKDKWKSNLTPVQIKNIEAIIKVKHV